MPRLLQGRGTIHACQIRKACARPAEGPRKARQGQREAQRAPAGSAKNARAKRAGGGNDNLSELSYDPSVAWEACANPARGARVGDYANHVTAADSNARHR